MSPIAEATTLDRSAILDLRTYPDPILRTKLADVDDINDRHKTLVKQMHFIRHVCNGWGLAAVQTGLFLRLFVWADDTDAGECFNPRIVDHSDETVEGIERCLSLPALRIPVERYERVQVEYLNIEGEPKTRYLEGDRGRLFQHEIDHLDGKLITDRTSAEAKRALMLL